MARANALLQRRRDHPQHCVADVIAVAVVDRLEPIELERENDQRLVFLDRGLAKLLALIGKTLAVEQPGHSISRGDQSGPRLAFLAHLGFMLKVDVAAPAEQDQRDVEGQGDGRHLEAGPEVPGDCKALKDFAAVPDQKRDGGDEDAKHQHVPPRIGERYIAVPRRGLSKRKTTHKR